MASCPRALRARRHGSSKRDLEWGLATFLECLTTRNDRSTPESGRRGRRRASPLWPRAAVDQRVTANPDNERPNAITRPGVTDRERVAPARTFSARADYLLGSSAGFTY